jgi:hypothetical protein
VCLISTTTTTTKITNAIQQNNTYHNIIYMSDIDFRPIDDQYALIALQHKLQLMSAAYAPSKRVSIQKSKELNEEYLAAHLSVDENDVRCGWGCNNNNFFSFFFKFVH